MLASAGTLLVLIALPWVPAAAAESAASPLPASDYTVRHVCPAPTPGYAGCLALELVARTAAARAHSHPLGITRRAPATAGAAAHACTPPTAGEGCYGLRPEDLHSIYRLPTTVASEQTIALVDAYNDLSAEADLQAYDKEFGLSECTDANRCFQQVNQEGLDKETGKPPFPASDEEREAEEAICEHGTGEAQEHACKEVEEAEGWSEEISLDIEASHATCESCKIVLVEANSASFGDLEAAEQAAVGLHATEISNSWGGPQPNETVGEDNASSFNHPGIVITAAAGDDGYLDWDTEGSSGRGYVDYPAASPHVVAVGGTRLQGPLGPEGTWAGETVWNGDGAGGGGCSTQLAAPIWQLGTSDWESVGCRKHRAVADVSADADPYTGIAVYDSGLECKYEEGGIEHTTHWCTIAGTSLASPLIASVFALAGGANGVAYPAQTLYENQIEDPTTLHDVLTGSNGECTEPFNEEDGFAAGTSGCTVSAEAAQCSGHAICTAGPGYDGPTGVGTPDGILAFEPVSEEVKRANEEGRRAAGKQQEEAQQREAKQDEEAAAREAVAREEAIAQETAAAQEETAAYGASNGGSTGSPGTSSAGSSLGSPSGTLPKISGAPAIKLTAFALTPTALLALNHARPKVSSVTFAFTLSAAARVRVTLAKSARVRGLNRWETLPGALAFAAVEGRNRRSLASRGPLAPGHYRLTLAPKGGVARTITFEVG